MNKEFKVGQRVWLIEEKQFARIVGEKRMTDFGERYAVYNEEVDLLEKHECEIHQTADDMFKELGYEQFDLNDKRFIEHKNNGDCIQIKDNQIIECLLYSPNIKEKHQAIHQKLIELGLI